MRHAMFAAAAAAVLCGPAALAAIPMNRPVTVSGVRTVCTGVGQREEDNPRWSRYPVRIEFTDKKGGWTTGAAVVISQANGNPVERFTCPANWALMSLKPGNYKVTAAIGSGPGSVESADFTAPKTGQKRVILAFRSAAAQ